MKTMMFNVYFTLFISLFAFSACSSDDDDYTPDDAIVATLAELYPNAKDISWERKASYMIADCLINGKDADVWFDANAKWCMTEYDVLYIDLPEAVINALKATEYSTWEIDDADLLEYADGTTLYVVEVESKNVEYQLFFSNEGELVEKKDVSHIDDTNWPK